MTVTSADVARRAGVSRSTVSQVLNGHGHRFPASTRDRVQAAASELGYQPSAAGRALVRGASDIIVALIPDVTFGPGLHDFLDGLTDELARDGLTLLLRLASTSAESTERMITGLRPAAVLSLLPLPGQLRDRIENSGVRLVEPGPPGDRDVNVEIGQAQARHLLERGYRRVAYAHLCDQRKDSFGSARERGVARVCEHHGLPRPPAVRLAASVDEAIAQLRALGPGTAIACYNDDVAAALLRGCRELGLWVPQDVALAGTDDTPIARLSDPAITTFGYALGPAVSEAAREILAALSAGGQYSAYPHGFQIRLVQGGTT
jgi:DNA-binding LacI/PurR family transcriptional regulator